MPEIDAQSRAADVKIRDRATYNPLQLNLQIVSFSGFVQ